MSDRDKQNVTANVRILTKTGASKLGSQELIWHRDQIYSLLHNIEKVYADFSDAKKKKKTIWQAIAREMGKEGYNCSGSDCDKKWRNLKATYMKVLKKHSYGLSKTRFEYFDAMHHLLGVDSLGMSENGEVRGSEAIPEQRKITGQSDFQELLIDSKGFVWISAAVNLLLDHIKVYLGNESYSGTIQDKWNEIAELMIIEGYPLTAEQCREKWENMQNGYYHHHKASQIMGKTPNWVYYFPVHDVMVALNIATSAQVTVAVPKRLSSRRAARIQTEDKKLFKRTYVEVDYQANSSRSLLDRVQDLESNFNIHRRLDALEERVEQNAHQREVYKQTNNVLTQIVAELKKINQLVEAENSKFSRIHHMDQPQRANSPSQGIIIVEDLSAQL